MKLDLNDLDAIERRERMVLDFSDGTSPGRAALEHARETLALVRLARLALQQRSS